MIDKANESHTAAAATGLRGVVVGASTVSDVVGDKGQLIYQGYNLLELAKSSNFEEVAFLLWNKRLPCRAELDELKRAIGEAYTVPKPIIDLLRQIPREADPIDRRNKCAYLTPSGAAMLREMQASIEAAHRELVKPLAPAAREQFLEQLLCLVQANNDKGRSPLRSL